jgi:hypothetical protein
VIRRRRAARYRNLFSFAQGGPETALVRASQSVEWDRTIDLFCVEQAHEIVGVGNGGSAARDLFSFAQGGPETAPIRTAQDIERDRTIDLFCVEQAHEIIGAGDGGAVEGQQNIAGEKARVIGRASRFDRAHHGARPLREAEVQRNSARHWNRASADAEKGAANPSMRDKFSEHETCRIGGHREANSLRAGDDRGVDADHLALRRDQRAARIAGIESRIGLNHIVDQTAVATGGCCGDALLGTERFELLNPETRAKRWAIGA